MLSVSRQFCQRSVRRVSLTSSKRFVNNSVLFGEKNNFKRLSNVLVLSGITSFALVMYQMNHTNCAVNPKNGGDVVMLAPTKEPATGILFPNLCNGLKFVGCGVRVKYGFVKVRNFIIYAYHIESFQHPINYFILSSFSYLTLSVK
jgi:hypothetical protein